MAISRTMCTTLATATILLSAAPQTTARRRSRPPTKGPKTYTKTTATKKSTFTPKPTVFACGTTLSHAISSLSYSTLCPTGLDEACPSNQHCYAGIPSDTRMKEYQLNAEDEMIQSHVDARLKHMNHDNDQEVQERFVCGVSWEDALDSLSCDAASSTVEAQVPSRAIACPSGLSSQCPSHMECYASVSCPQVDKIQEVVSINEHGLNSKQNLSRNDVQEEVESADIGSLSWYDQVRDYSNRLNLWGYGSC